MTKILYHKCHYGFGDNIYERPFVISRSLRYDEIYIETYFPQLYHDFPNFHFVRPPQGLSALQLQNQNADAFSEYVDPPAGGFTASCFRFKRDEIGFLDHLKYFEPGGLRFLNFHVPEEWVGRAHDFVLGWHFNSAAKRICLLKRPVLHDPPHSWQPAARIPRQEYFQQAVDLLGEDFFVVSIADISRNGEKIAYPIDGVDLELHHGEIDIWTLFAMVNFVDVNLCSPSFFIPMCLSQYARFFCIYGAWETPSYHFPFEMISLSSVPEWAAPKPCTFKQLDAGATDEQKIIKGFPEIFSKWINFAL